MFNNLPSKVRLVEVGPRDGLQNEKEILSTEDKVEYIRLLAEAGLCSIEATSFVRADKVPQMGDATDLFSGLKNNVLNSDDKLEMICLVPNPKGLELALSSGVKEIALFTATSETFNNKNINQSVGDSLKNIESLIKTAKDNGIKVRSYISTAFGCPYEGVPKDNDQLIKMTEKLYKWGSYDISIGDTIGVATPLQVNNYLEKISSICPIEKLSMHFHDTEGRALSNIMTSLELGVTSFDCSSGGLGGCPFAKGATGNVATEDVVSLMESMGIHTGVDMEKLVVASQFILSKVHKKTTSKYLQSYLAKKEIKNQ